MKTADGLAGVAGRFRGKRAAGMSWPRAPPFNHWAVTLRKRAGYADRPGSGPPSGQSYGWSRRPMGLGKSAIRWPEIACGARRFPWRTRKRDPATGQTAQNLLW